MTLFETNNKYLLVAGDKTIRELHVISIKKLLFGKDGVVDDVNESTSSKYKKTHKVHPCVICIVGGYYRR